MNRYTYTGEDVDPDRIQQRTPEAASAEEAQSPRRRRVRREQPEEHEGPREPGIVDRTVGFFTDKKTHAVLGIALILLAGYLALAAFSFIRANAADQSLVASETVEQIVESGRHIENMAGPVGAKVSHHLFVEGLGLGSIVLIVYIVLIALALLGARKVKFWSLTLKTLIFAITLSMVFGLITINSSAVVPLGGYHGRFANIFLMSRIGWIGAAMVSVLLIALLVTIYIAQLTSIYRKSREKLQMLRDRREHELEQERFRQEQVDQALSDGPLNEQTEEDPEQKLEEEQPKPQQNTSVMLHDLPEPEPEDPEEEMERIKRPVEKKPAASTVLDSIEETDPSEADPDAKDPVFEVQAAEEIEQAKKQNTAYEKQGPYDPRAELSRFRMPTLDLLHERPRKAGSVDREEQEANKERITKVLGDYGIDIVKIEATVGPTVTLYKIVPAEGVRIAKIKRLEDDIAMSLAALGIRIIAPIPGESNIGIEVPNKDPETVSIRSILGSKAFQETKFELPMAMGATINNEVYIADLAKMPHLLVAGATGQGKSVGLNTIIASLLYKRHPSELKFVLVDPKMVEFSLYSRIEKHYLAQLPDAPEPVITDCNRVVDTLNSLCVEMGNRYALLKDAGCRQLKEYNTKFVERKLNPEKGHRFLPYIVTIVDEFSDLIMMAGKSVETPIARIAQKARAVGMHLIIATQRPSTNVITGMIKANFPGRMAFAVRQRVDSQTILDCTGANQLIGRGDMLISTGGALQRVQCAFIDTDEVEAICQFIDDQVGFPTPYILPEPPSEAAENQSFNTFGERDPLFDEIARLVVQGNTASTSNIQRKYSIGYNRAGKIMDQMEAAGIVGPAQGGKPRQVLITPMDLEMILNQS